MPWKYDPGEAPKRKHHWDEDIPGFVEQDGELVGKCPRNMTNEDAERLVNDGIPWHNPRLGEIGWPDSIYVVHQGAVYRAVPTRAGISYHGFPEHGRKLRSLPKRVRDRILQRAVELGCESEVRAWIEEG